MIINLARPRAARRAEVGRQIAMVRTSPKYVLALVILAALLALGWFAFGFIRPSVGYCVEAEFASMPADDRRLLEWLRTQPGVVTSTVHIEREGGKLRASFIVSRDRRGQPLPDLQGQCGALGYSGQVGRFKDCDK